MTRMNIVQLADEDRKDVFVKLRDGDVLVDEMVKETVRELNMRNDEKNLRYGRWRAYVTLGVLLLANLLNYIDRYTLAGVLSDVKSFYNINNADTGLLQTSFIVSYMLLSPIFGYLGDRYNRKIIMAVGIFFWSGVTLAGSFVPRENFYTFLFLRAMVGVGEASYSTIAPTIIADLFVKDMRTKALTVFYIAIPLGSGLGYIVGSNVAHAMGAWQWALRITPVFGIFCVLMILLVLREPPRGAAEGGSHLANTSWFTDVKSLMKNKSFLLSTGGFTCVAFVAGALALWAPLFMEYAIFVQNKGHTMKELELSVPWKFGIITCVAGLLGVTIGAETGRRLRRKYGNADPLVCAFGLVGSAPMFCLAIYLADKNTVATWIFVFLGETLLCLNWSLVTDMLLYIVVPTRRSTAEAIQILISHALGDAGSPYLIGAVSDAISRSRGFVHSVSTKFASLQLALYISCFVCVIGGGLFLATAMFICHDRGKVDRYIQGILTDSEGSNNSSTSSMIQQSEGAVSISGGRDPSFQPLVTSAEVA